MPANPALVYQKSARKRFRARFRTFVRRPPGRAGHPMPSAQAAPAGAAKQAHQEHPGHRTDPVAVQRRDQDPGSALIAPMSRETLRARDAVSALGAARPRTSRRRLPVTRRERAAEHAESHQTHVVHELLLQAREQQRTSYLNNGSGPRGLRVPPGCKRARCHPSPDTLEQVRNRLARDGVSSTSNAGILRKRKPIAVLFDRGHRPNARASNSHPTPTHPLTFISPTQHGLPN